MKTPKSLTGFKGNPTVISSIKSKFAGTAVTCKVVQEGLSITADAAWFNLNKMVLEGEAAKPDKFNYIIKAVAYKKAVSPSDIIPETFSGPKKILSWHYGETKSSMTQAVYNAVSAKLQFVVIDTQSHKVPHSATKVEFEPSALSKSAWRTKWELEDLNLQRECANFYTAADICSTAEGQGIRSLLLDPVVTRLSKQFANYLDMALGGELRHCSYKMGNLTSQMSLSPVHAAVLGKAKSGGSRHDMWLEWHEIRQIYGLDALKIARDAFLKGSWSSAFGGKKWGLAASILVQYLEGEINSVIFVDTVWSLQHNTSWILNKVWQIPGNMKQLLDDKFAGRIEKVVTYASPELQEAWKFEAQMRQVDENIRRIREEREQEQIEDKKHEVAILAGILKAKAKRDAEVQAAKAVQMLAEAQEVLNG